MNELDQAMAGLREAYAELARLEAEDEARKREIIDRAVEQIRQGFERALRVRDRTHPRPDGPPSPSKN